MLKKRIHKHHEWILSNVLVLCLYIYGPSKSYKQILVAWNHAYGKKDWFGYLWGYFYLFASHNDCQWVSQTYLSVLCSSNLDALSELVNVVERFLKYFYTTQIAYA